MQVILIVCFHLLLIPINIAASDHLRSGSVRSIALGGNEVLLSAGFNPALAVMESRGALFDYHNRYSMRELGAAGLSFYLPHPSLSSGLHLASFGYDEWRETFFGLAVGKRLCEGIAIGAGVRYAVLQTELYDAQRSQLAVDVGMIWLPSDEIGVALAAMNFPSAHFPSGNDGRAELLPACLQAGLQWRGLEDVIMLVTVCLDEFRSFGINAGVAYRVFDRFEMRCGMKSNPATPSFGVGVDYAPLAFDVAAEYHPALGFGHGIGISYRF